MKITAEAKLDDKGEVVEIELASPAGDRLSAAKRKAALRQLIACIKQDIRDPG